MRVIVEQEIILAVGQDRGPRPRWCWPRIRLPDPLLQGKYREKLAITWDTRQHWCPKMPPERVRAVNDRVALGLAHALQTMGPYSASKTRKSKTKKATVRAA
jgi:hypothetical protein